MGIRTSDSPRTTVIDEYRKRFGDDPSLIVRSPGRVNLIGDHTDYNLGIALPMALAQGVWLAASARDGRVVDVTSTLDGSRQQVRLDGLDPIRTGWVTYVEGIAHELQVAGFDLRGWNAAVHSDLPVGAGLSSSAAFELAIARVFVEAIGGPWEPMRMAKLAQRAENDWVGMECGLLDQMSSALAVQGSALLMDFRDLSVSEVPLPDGLAILVLDSGVRRKLTDSRYNERRSESLQAAQALGLDTLRDVGYDDLARLSGTSLKRARHVVTENLAVREAVEAFENEDLEEAGRIFGRSHASLRDDYEVSTEEIDALVELATSVDGCFGARMTGGGFGGSVVALTESGRVDEIARSTLATYRDETGRQGSWLEAVPSEANSVELL